MQQHAFAPRQWTGFGKPDYGSALSFEQFHARRSDSGSGMRGQLENRTCEWVIIACSSYIIMMTQFECGAYH